MFCAEPTLRPSSNRSFEIKKEGVSHIVNPPTRIRIAGTAAIAREILQPSAS